MTVRQQVLNYVRSHRAVTAGDIARALNMTGANARHHLGILESNSLVRAVGFRPGLGRGRPAKLYSLSFSGEMNFVCQLADIVLDEFVVDVNPEVNEVHLKRLAKSLLQKYGDSETNSKADKYNVRITTTQRLYKAISLLNTMDYNARWEARSDSPFIILGNCPYRSIIEQHPELCTVDQYLFEELLDTDVFQLEKLGIDTQGIENCLFQIA